MVYNEKNNFGGFVKMKKKILSILLCGVMAATMLMGCGNSENTETTGETAVAETTEESTEAGEATEENTETVAEDGTFCELWANTHATMLIKTKKFDLKRVGLLPS